jgi:phosphohistidine phosphatase
MRYRLILMRHAKSSWTSGAASDHARPLNGRGRNDAPRVGGRLLELGWIPDLVVTSDSTRTLQTLDGVRAAMDLDCEVVATRDLYHAGTDEVREACYALPDAVETVLMLGHNPGWEDALHDLCGESQPMTTANAALLSVEARDWTAAINSGGWTLHELIRPREL